MPSSKKATQRYDKPLTLAPLTFDQAVDRLLKAKPTKPKKKSRPRKQA